LSDGSVVEWFTLPVTSVVPVEPWVGFIESSAVPAEDVIDVSLVVVVLVVVVVAHAARVRQMVRAGRSVVFFIGTVSPSPLPFTNFIPDFGAEHGN
jgi:hypothetical protein